MDSQLKLLGNGIIEFASQPWDILHSAVNDRIDELRSHQPIVPASLNPMYAAIHSQLIGWDVDQRTRAVWDLRCAETCLARQDVLSAMRMLNSLKRRLERSGVRQRSTLLHLLSQQKKQESNDAVAQECVAI